MMPRETARQWFDRVKDTPAPRLSLAELPLVQGDGHVFVSFQSKFRFDRSKRRGFARPK